MCVLEFKFLTEGEEFRMRGVQGLAGQDIGLPRYVGPKVDICSFAPLGWLFRALGFAGLWVPGYGNFEQPRFRPTT